MPLETVIIEDELPARERLKSLLVEIGEVEIVGEAGDGPDGARLIDAKKPDLAFLDIQLPVFSGFEILEKIHHRPYVIFITAYDAYAIKAFEANAVDYLLKPTTPERLRSAVERVKKRNPQDVEKLLSTLKKTLLKPEYQERFPIRIGDEIRFIQARGIYWFHAEDKYVFLHTEQEQYLLDATLKTLEETLDPQKFIRIHKSVIINCEKLNRIKRNLTGHYKVELNDEKKSTFEIGRTYLAKVREQLGF